jgi:hypothetical protein
MRRGSSGLAGVEPAAGRLGSSGKRTAATAADLQENGRAKTKPLLGMNNADLVFDRHVRTESRRIFLDAFQDAERLVTGRRMR